MYKNRTNMFLKVFVLIAFITPAMLAKLFSDDSEVLLSVVGDDEVKAKRQAEFFDSIQGAIEKYEKSADEHLAPLKLLNNNYNPYDTLVYPNVQQPYVRNTNHPIPNFMPFNLYTQQQKNIGYSQPKPPEPLFSPNRQYMPYMGLNYRILPPIYMSSDFGSIPRIYNPQHLQEVASARAIFLGDQLVNVEKPSCKCSKEIIKSPFDNQLNESKTDTEKLLKITEFAQPSSTTERSFEIQKVTQNQLLTRVAVIARGGNARNVKQMPTNIKTIETTTRDNGREVKSSTLTRTENSSTGSLTNRGQIQSRKASNLNTKNISENSSKHKNRSLSTTSNSAIKASETLIISSRNQAKQNSINLANNPQLRALSVDFTSTTLDEMDADSSTTEIQSTTPVTITESPSTSTKDDETVTSTTTISTDTTTTNTDDGNSTTQSSTVTPDSTQNPSTTTEMPRSSTTPSPKEIQYYYTKKAENYSLTNKYVMKNSESSKSGSNYSSSSLRSNRMRSDQMRTNNAHLRTISLSNNGQFKSVNVGRKSTKLADKYVEAQEVESMKMDTTNQYNPSTDCMCGTDSNQVNVWQRPQNKDPYAAPILSETYSVKYPEFKSNSPTSSIYWHKSEEKTLNQPKEGGRQTWQIIQTQKYDDNDSPELEIYSNEDDYENLYETGEREEYYFT